MDGCDAVTEKPWQHWATARKGAMWQVGISAGVLGITSSLFWWNNCCLLSRMSWVSGHTFRPDQSFCNLDVVTRFPALVHLKLLSLFPFALLWCRCTQTLMLPSQDRCWDLSLRYLAPHCHPFSTMPGPTQIRFMRHADMLLICAQLPCLEKGKKLVYKVPFS